MICSSANCLTISQMAFCSSVRSVGEVVVAGSGHAFALGWWGTWKRWDQPGDLIVRTDRRPKGVRVHRAVLARRDITRQNGIPVTTLARTLLDMAPKMKSKSLNRAVND